MIMFMFDGVTLDEAKTSKRASRRSECDAAFADRDVGIDDVALVHSPTEATNPGGLDDGWRRLHVVYLVGQAGAVRADEGLCVRKSGKLRLSFEPTYGPER